MPQEQAFLDQSSPNLIYHGAAIDAFLPCKIHDFISGSTQMPPQSFWGKSGSREESAWQRTPRKQTLSPRLGSSEEIRTRFAKEFGSLAPVPVTSAYPNNGEKGVAWSHEQNE